MTGQREKHERNGGFKSLSESMRGQFTNPHARVLSILSENHVSYLAEEVVRAYGQFYPDGRAIAFKVDVLVNDPRYGAGIIEVDGGYHQSAHQQLKTEKRDSILKGLGFWILHIPNKESKDVMRYLEVASQAHRLKVSEALV